MTYRCKYTIDTILFVGFGKQGPKLHLIDIPVVVAKLKENKPDVGKGQSLGRVIDLKSGTSLEVSLEHELMWTQKYDEFAACVSFWTEVFYWDPGYCIQPTGRLRHHYILIYRLTRSPSDDRVDQLSPNFLAYLRMGRRSDDVQQRIFLVRCQVRCISEN